MQHTKVSYELTQNYIPSPQAKEKEPVDPASAIENRLMREIVRENLTKRQKCYIIMYYTKGMTMQEIADRLGLPDHSYLVRYFKRHEGMSPREYQNRYVI